MAAKNVEEQRIDQIMQDKPKAQGIAFILGTFGPSGVSDDLRNMEDVFSDDLNFAVYRRDNLTSSEMKTLIEAAAIKQYPMNYKFIAIYFAGHGGSNMNGDSFVVPMDPEGKHGDEFVYIEKDIIRPFEGRQSKKMNLFFFDCCSNVSLDAMATPPPFQAKAVIHNSLVAYATAFGQKASGSKGSGGVWTRSLYANLKKDLPLTSVLNNVRGEVGSKQESNYHTNLPEVNLKASAKLQKVDVMKKEPKNDDVFNLLRGYSAQFEGFGRAFGIDLNTRRRIKRRADDDEEILELFINEWTQGKTKSPVTWEFLVQTVLIEGLKLRKLAGEVKEFLDREDIQDAYRDAKDWKPTE